MDKDYLNVLIDTIASTENVLTFLHNTNKEEVALKILKSGFQFHSHLDYCTDYVSAKDAVTIKYFTIIRQAYGNFTVVIQISKKIIEDYSDILENTPHHFSEILSINDPILGVDEEFIYQLAPQFVKGFVNSVNSELVLNPNFNSTFRSSIFQDNLDKIQYGNKNSEQ